MNPTITTAIEPPTCGDSAELGEPQRNGDSTTAAGSGRRPPPQLVVGRNPVAFPYQRGEEAAMRLAAGLPGWEHPEEPMAVAAISLGAGANGPEISAASIHDLRVLDNERLALVIRGHDPRLVPVRGCCTGLLMRAAHLVARRQSSSGRFIVSSQSPARIASRISLGETVLRLRRARSTWLLAHLRAGTQLPVLREIAGPLSAHTLNNLLDLSEITVDPGRALIEGLGA